MAPSAALLGALLAPENASAAVLRPLILSTVLTARAFRAGKAAALGVVPASVLSLSEGVLHAMFLTKLKLAAAGLLTFGLLASGVGVLAQQPTPAPVPPSEASPAPDSSRLREVERKIDRLLKVLEGPPQPLAAPVPAPPTTPPPPPVVAYPRLEPGNRPLALPTTSVAIMRSPDEADRLAKVEHRLEQVEKKLDQVIRQIGGLRSEDTFAPQAK
jgi:hypothetical protein